jgi:hypothetical protein
LTPSCRRLPGPSMADRDVRRVRPESLPERMRPRRCARSLRAARAYPLRARSAKNPRKPARAQALATTDPATLAQEAAPHLAPLTNANRSLRPDRTRRS